MASGPDCHSRSHHNEGESCSGGNGASLVMEIKWVVGWRLRGRSEWRCWGDVELEKKTMRVLDHCCLAGPTATRRPNIQCSSAAGAKTPCQVSGGLADGRSNVEFVALEGAVPCESIAVVFRCHEELRRHREHPQV